MADKIFSNQDIYLLYQCPSITVPTKGMSSSQLQIFEDVLRRHGCTELRVVRDKGVPPNGGGLASPEGYGAAELLTMLTSLRRKGRRKLIILTEANVLSSVGAVTVLHLLLCTLLEQQPSALLAQQTRDICNSFSALAGYSDSLRVASHEWLSACATAKQLVPIAPYTLRVEKDGFGVSLGVAKDQRKPAHVVPEMPVQQSNNPFNYSLAVPPSPPTDPRVVEANPSFAARTGRQPSPPIEVSEVEVPPSTWPLVWPPKQPVAQFVGDGITEAPLSTFRDFAVMSLGKQMPLVTVSATVFEKMADPPSAYPSTEMIDIPNPDPLPTVVDTRSDKGGFIPIFFGAQSAVNASASTASQRLAFRPSNVTAEGESAWLPFVDVVAEERLHPQPIISPFATDRMVRQLNYIDRVRPFAIQKPISAPDATLTSVPAERVAKESLAAPNQHLLDELARLKDVYAATGDHWRQYAYNRAIGVIKRHQSKVVSGEELRSYPGIGEKIYLKIKEILATGTSSKLARLKASPEVMAIEAFTRVWGIGPTTAKRIANLRAPVNTSDDNDVDDGGAVLYSTIEDLRSRPPAFLSTSQRFGLTYLEDLEQRIPRSEVDLIAETVISALTRIGFSVNRDATQRRLTEATASNSPHVVEAASCSRSHHPLDVIVCGSYRRGKPTSGDVDVLICDRSGKRSDGILRLLLEELRKSGADFKGEQTKRERSASIACNSSAPKPFILGELTTSFKSQHESSSCDTWFGIVQLPDCTNKACACSHRSNNEKTEPKPEPRSVSIGLKREREMSTASNVGQPPLVGNPYAQFMEGSHHLAPVPCPASYFNVDEDGDDNVAEEVAERSVSPAWRWHGHDAEDAKFFLQQSRQPSPSVASSRIESTIGFSPPIAQYVEGRHFARRLDIKVYPAEQFPFAVLYFTGSDYFNRSMRLYCHKRGLSLSDHGLLHVIRVKKEAIHEGASVPCYSERDIFEAIGLPYRWPHERDL